MGEFSPSPFLPSLSMPHCLQVLWRIIPLGGHTQ